MIAKGTWPNYLILMSHNFLKCELRIMVPNPKCYYEDKINLYKSFSSVSDEY